MDRGPGRRLQAVGRQAPLRPRGRSARGRRSGSGAIGGEGFDNDGDGRINEDDIGGPDPNRNFPFGWSLADGWPYPMSKHETRNVFEFQLQHPNIFATFHFHNTGRLIMFHGAAADTRRRRAMTTERRTAQAGARRSSSSRSCARPTSYALALRPRVVAPDTQDDLDSPAGRSSPTGARILKDYTADAQRARRARRSAGGLLRARAPTAYLIELWGRSRGRGRRQRRRPSVDDEEVHGVDGDLELTGEGWIDPQAGQAPRPRRRSGSADRRGSTSGRTPPAPLHRDRRRFGTRNFVLYCGQPVPEGRDRPGHA
ncbi:MAG: hypothetical protein MZU84_04575 [Sphingobacterium sp.]|nr:hypothetical protein [Sphingobacterium sp.]